MAKNAWNDASKFAWSGTGSCGEEVAGGELMYWDMSWLGSWMCWLCNEVEVEAVALRAEGTETLVVHA